MGTLISTSQKSGSKQVQSESNAIDVVTAANQHKQFLEQLTSQSCDLVSSIKEQKVTVDKLSTEKGMPRDAETAMVSSNKSLLDIGLRIQQTVDAYKISNQPAIALASKHLTASSSSKKQRISVKAQLYFPRTCSLASAIVSEISEMLRTRFNVDSMDLALETVDQGSSVRPGVPVMVICINISRLGTDVTSALQNLAVNKLMSLVVMHHRDIHALPSQSSEQMLTSAEYKQLGGIFDMAFVTGKGIYHCDMNDRTISAIVDFIKQHN